MTGGGSSLGKDSGKGGCNPGLYKTQMCRYFEMGTCTRGAECAFAHSEGELQPRGMPKGAAPPWKGGGDSWGKGGGDAWGKSSGGSWGKGCGDSWGGQGFIGGAKGFGKDGKKGKSKSKGKGHTLDRMRISEDPVTGVTVEWRGKFGWIEPHVPIEHPKAERHGGRIFVSVADLAMGSAELVPGTSCQFLLFEDASGLGAEEVIAVE